MNSRCAECEAIRREFREALIAANEHGLPASSGSLTEWLRDLDDAECARMRETSDLWKTWRRWREHRAVTGHTPSLAAPPDAISNPN